MCPLDGRPSFAAALSHSGDALSFRQARFPHPRDKIGVAVEEAIDLLGGINTVAKGKERIMLKPNRTKNEAILNGMQQYVFDQLGYTELAQSMHIPLINLHSGEMVEVSVPGAFLFDKISLHRSLTDIDLLCSVPMMKTHVLASVTLGMKNLIGLYPGSIYGSVRAGVHDRAAKAGSRGIAFEIVDMVRASKLGLVVVDGSTAMEGNGPTEGSLVKMGVIVAGTNPLATDMVAARIMGLTMKEIPTFTCAQRAGMKPSSFEEIEVRGERISNVGRMFKKPAVVSWESIGQVWGVKEMQ